MHKVKIEVTKADIAKHDHRVEHCPIARAVRRQFPKVKYIQVGALKDDKDVWVIRLRCNRKKVSWKNVQDFIMPKTALKWVKQYDDYDVAYSEIQPFSFYMNV